MKKLNSLFKISLVIIVAMLMVSCQKQVDYGPQIQTLTNSVSALQAALNSSIASLQKSRDSLSSALTKTNANLTSTNTNVSNLGLRMDSVKTALVGINAQLTYLSLRIDSANTNIVLLNTQMATANSNITTINAQIVVINTNIANFTSLINTLNQQYNNLLTTLNSILAQLAITPSTLSNGLMAWYPFTGNANDSSTYVNNGTIVGATLTTDRFGNSNSAYSFNGTSNYINLPNTFFNGTQVSNFSISINFYLNQLPSTNNSYYLWAKNGFWQALGIGINSLGKITFGGSVTTNKYQNCNSNNNIVSPGSWNNLIIIYNNTDCKMYLNGNLIPVTLETTDQGGTHLTNTMVGFVEFAENAGGNSNATNIIGASNSVSTGNTTFTNGKIDELRIYNRTLTSNEISYLSTH
jgi:prefoldin subunit 5